MAAKLFTSTTFRHLTDLLCRTTESIHGPYRETGDTYSQHVKFLKYLKYLKVDSLYLGQNFVMCNNCRNKQTQVNQQVNQDISEQSRLLFFFFSSMTQLHLKTIYIYIIQYKNNALFSSKAFSIFVL